MMPGNVGLQDRTLFTYFDGAVKDFTTSIQLKPDDVDVCNERGNVLLSKGDQESAQRDFDKAKFLCT